MAKKRPGLMKILPERICIAFAQQGRAINFLLIENEIHFAIHLAVAQKASFSLSVQLLQVGKVVDSEQ